MEVGIAASAIANIDGRALLLVADDVITSLGTSACAIPIVSPEFRVPLSRVPECRAARVYMCVWYRAVFTLWRQSSYMRSSRVFTAVYCTVCTPSPRPDSMLRGFNDFSRRWHPLCLLAALDEVVKAYGLTAGAIMLQGVFSPCESDTPRAPGLTDCP
ncbi:hypothetical protein EVAR_5585_1 [Eumeta japonica]|uniref:Uncharacterized protein n=1 Tax=Eumeta variegata TaxID=151549 RepID=A0A4C1U1D0_EUMVA|nr:hypothetical protein EVAR_5585_1 [Eumeta japonica]